GKRRAIDIEYTAAENLELASAVRECAAVDAESGSVVDADGSGAVERTSGHCHRAGIAERSHIRGRSTAHEDGVAGWQVEAAAIDCQRAAVDVDRVSVRSERTGRFDLQCACRNIDCR